MYSTRAINSRLCDFDSQTTINNKLDKIIEKRKFTKKVKLKNNLQNPGITTLRRSI